MKKVEKNKSYLHKLKVLCSEEKSKKAIIICGLIGIVLIFASNFLDGCSKTGALAETKTDTTATEQFKNETEKKLASIISSIDGAGSAKIMVTVDCSGEYVYAENSKLTGGDAASSETSNQFSNESTYITIKLSDGTQQAVKLKEIEPKIRGVLVVCSGGEQPLIKQRILEAVTKALDISSAKVCVTKLSEQ